jgi:hypothetical protein
VLPPFLIRAAVDWVRHSEKYKDSNPYTRGADTLKLIRRLWQEEFGRLESTSLEPAVLIAYWEEFFHAEDPTPDEREWREGLKKRASDFDSYEEWGVWFKQNYAEVYIDNSIWKSVIMTAWADTHQYVVRYQAGNWRFVPSKSYLLTSAMWDLEPHFSLVKETLKRVWSDEMRAYGASGFRIKDEAGTLFGSVEALGFDTRQYTLYFPAKSDRDPVNLDSATMVADIVAPIGNEWYRQLDHVIFAENFVDVTALTNRARYVFASRRRMLELLVDSDWQNAYFQAAAEGWLVEEKSIA